MTNNKLRTVVLQKFYDSNGKSDYRPISSEFDFDITEDMIISICGQLTEKGYIKWKHKLSVNKHDVDKSGCSPLLYLWEGAITASGIDVIELGENKVNENTTIIINHSSNIQIGDNNQQIDEKHNDDRY